MKKQAIAVLIGKKCGGGSIISLNGSKIHVDNEFPERAVGDELYVEEIIPQRTCSTCGGSNFYDQQQEDYYCPVHD